MVEEWWGVIWRSPQSSEWLESDRRGLFVVADLYDRLYSGVGHSEFIAISREIRLQEQRFGLSPMDRRKLQWTVAQAEKVTKRKPPAPPGPTDDPRKALRAI